ncbi:hypothetical protein KM043_004925 [Ampulex compressa]|nr:hypothetical protein KM043_004925 [Ampulex compressa]
MSSRVYGRRAPRGSLEGVESILWYWRRPRKALLPAVEEQRACGRRDDNDDVLSGNLLPVVRLFGPAMRLFVNMYCTLLLSIVVVAHATIYIPPLIREEHLLTDTMLSELINQMGNELAEAADSYLEYQDKPKEIPIELPADYDGIDTLNPNPSIRDQEYLQHSTLWSHQRISNNDKVTDRHKIQAGSLKGIKDEKTENTLPAYCTPPNPCPVGYTSENNCIVNFDNTAAFSRDYQSAQDCMCDTEHMLDCSVDSTNSNGLSGIHLSNSDFDSIVEQFQHENPFFQGDKLPIAAKKGINVVY